jgi:hypothetical protein
LISTPSTNTGFILNFTLYSIEQLHRLHSPIVFHHLPSTSTSPPSVQRGCAGLAHHDTGLPRPLPSYANPPVGVGQRLTIVGAASSLSNSSPPRCHTRNNYPRLQQHALFLLPSSPQQVVELVAECSGVWAGGHVRRAGGIMIVRVGSGRGPWGRWRRRRHDRPNGQQPCGRWR